MANTYLIHMSINISNTQCIMAYSKTKGKLVVRDHILSELTITDLTTPYDMYVSKSEIQLSQRYHT